MEPNQSVKTNLPAGLAAPWLRAKAARNAAEWEPPLWEDLIPYLKPDALQLSHNGLVREVQVLNADRQFRLQISLAAIDAPLSPVREEWLKAFLEEAMICWPLVEFKITDNKEAVIAEVDLTGADQEDFMLLLKAALDSFRWIVRGLVETAELITAPRQSAMLDNFLPTGQTVQSLYKTKKQKNESNAPK